MRLRLLAAMLVLEAVSCQLSVVSCQLPTENWQLTTDNSPAAAAEESKETGWSTLKGQVVWASEIPEPEKLSVNKDKEHCLSKGDIYSEKLVVNKKNKGVQWAFVWLAPDPPDPKNRRKAVPVQPMHPSVKEPKEKEVVLDQPCCRFEPHCLAMREGQVLLVKNSAPITHNTHVTGNPLVNPGFNQNMPANSSYEAKDLKADRLPLKITCDIHPWMSGWLGVFNHAYFAVTDADGNFEIKLAPAGKYRLMVWQESIGYRGGAAGRDGIQITIKDSGVTDLGKLELKPSE